MTSCTSCRRFLRPIGVCALALDTSLNGEDCPDWTNDPPSSPYFLDLLRIIGRDNSWTNIPRWIRGFLSKDYFISSIEGFVFFHIPPKVIDIRKYKHMLFNKDVVIYKVYYRDKTENLECLYAVTNQRGNLPLLITSHSQYYTSKEDYVSLSNCVY